jgi:hypothetical protein
MKEYKVLLHRDYMINIKAKNEEEEKFQNLLGIVNGKKKKRNK